MLFPKNLCYCWILIISMNFFVKSYGSLISITSVKCQNLDEKFSKVNKCYLRRVSRTVSETAINITLLEEVTSSAVHLELVKKSNDRFNNYLFKSGSFNACKFLEKRSISPLGNYLFSMIEDSTNLNHSCPFSGNLIVDRFRLNMDRVKWIPMPSGDYGIISRWYAQGKARLQLSFFFTFSE